MARKNTQGQPQSLTPYGKIYFDEAGEWDLEKLKLLIGDKMPEFKREYFGDWQTPINDAKLTFCIEMIKNKHGLQFEIETRTNGDYIQVFMRGRPELLKIANTTLRTIDPGRLMDMIEKEFRLGGFSARDLQARAEEKMKNPTDSWAEKWARENQ